MQKLRNTSPPAPSHGLDSRQQTKQSAGTCDAGEKTNQAPPVHEQSSFTTSLRDSRKIGNQITETKTPPLQHSIPRGENRSANHAWSVFAQQSRERKNKKRKTTKKQDVANLQASYSTEQAMQKMAEERERERERKNPGRNRQKFCP
jgi:hypothetical protein